MNDRIDLDCGIAIDRIAKWLDEELRLPRQDDAWLYCWEAAGTCYVQATRLASRTIGPIAIERTHLVAYGDAEALAAFEKAFTLRFMSAGG